MAKTFTEADSQRATVHNESNAQPGEKQQRPREELRQRGQGWLAFLVAPIAVATATGATFLAFRRMLNNDQKNKRQ